MSTDKDRDSILTTFGQKTFHVSSTPPRTIDLVCQVKVLAANFHVAPRPIGPYAKIKSTSIDPGQATLLFEFHQRVLEFAADAADLLSSWQNEYLSDIQLSTINAAKSELDGIYSEKTIKQVLKILDANRNDIYAPKIRDRLLSVDSDEEFSDKPQRPSTAAENFVLGEIAERQRAMLYDWFEEYPEPARSFYKDAGEPDASWLSPRQQTTHLALVLHAVDFWSGTSGPKAHFERLKKRLPDIAPV